jgi:hypothetical protein
MFRIEVFVDDKRLAQVMHAMTGLIVSMSVPQPVVNAEVKKQGRIVAKSNGNLHSLFIEHLAKSKVDEIRPSQVADWLEQHGKSRFSANYLIKNLVKQGVLKRGPGKTTKTTYKVVQP